MVSSKEVALSNSQESQWIFWIQSFGFTAISQYCIESFFRVFCDALD
tara:strand:+ start:320 stop:460 length:141 start_codon:yes stop_codon:yes gene_type:complete